MADVVFIDTSILLCILDVPGKNQNRAPIYKEFLDLATNGDNTLILPAATIIETGNHIAQLSEGNVRRDRMTKLSDLLMRSASAAAPWVVGKADWSQTFIQDLVAGVPDVPIESLVELATQRVGIGDASIIHEAHVYRNSTSTPSGQNIRIWTLDAGLQAFS